MESSTHLADFARHPNASRYLRAPSNLNVPNHCLIATIAHSFSSWSFVAPPCDGDDSIQRHAHAAGTDLTHLSY
jgi:hypothetical protein